MSLCVNALANHCTLWWILLTYKHYYYTFLLISSVKQIIVVHELVLNKLTNTCRHEEVNFIVTLQKSVVQTTISN